MSKIMHESMDAFSDEALVRKAQGGNNEAFTELARRYQERIYHTIFRFTRNHGDTDDLTQETFMYAFKSLKGFRRKSSFFTWVYRIAVNHTLNFLKKKKQEQGREEFFENYSYGREAESEDSSPDVSSFNKELREKLEDAIESLPLSYKMSFVLVVFQGLTHNQAAKVLRCSENTVSWRMHKARKMLQAGLRPWLSGGGHEVP